MNLNKLMKQAQKMQEQMARTQAELEEKTVEVSAGGGKVKVVGERRRRRDFDQDRQGDRRSKRRGISGRSWCLSGVKSAIEQGKALAQSEMTKITGGLGLPGCTVAAVYDRRTCSDCRRSQSAARQATLDVCFVFLVNAHLANS